MKGTDYLQAVQEKKKEKRIGKQFTEAAKVLTATVNPDKDEILSSLLDNIYTIQNENRPKELHKFDRNYVESKWLDNKKRIDRRFEAKYETKAESSIIKMLLEQKHNEENEKKTPYVNKNNVQPESEIFKLLRQRNEKIIHNNRDKFKKQNSSIFPQKEARSTNNFETSESMKDRSVINTLLRSQAQISNTHKFEANHQYQYRTGKFKKQNSSIFPQKEARSTNNFETSESMKDRSIINTLLSSQAQISNTYKFEANHLYREKVPMSKTFKSEKEKEESIEYKEKMEELSRIKKFIKYERIFNNDFTNIPPIPELKTWNLCEKKELEILMNQYPKNGFEEMIQWTEEGKLWKFPIDNEQGMEKEHNVHFSKHVFLERHLEEWCPTKGPIRHFMELVCNGLSKNPYMTIEEKYNHIMWYKDYFNGKQDLLHKLGLIE
ncbi:28S ribosomal protein S31, mitochondrial [Anthophora plagiata]